MSYSPFKAYVVCYYILDVCYFHTYEEILADMLGIMSPDFWESGYPISPDIPKYWEKFLGERQVNKDTILQEAYDFLLFLEMAEPGYYVFPETKKYIEEHPESLDIALAEAKAQKLYEEHHYPEWYM